MKKLALLLSLLAFGALGPAACGEDDDDGSDASAATTTAPAAGTDSDRTPVAPTPAKYETKQVPKGTGRKAIRSGSASAYTPKVSKADNRVKLHTNRKSRVFKPTATAEAGDLTIIWKHRGDGPKRNFCMVDEQRKPVLKKVVFNGGRERSAESTPRCSQEIRARTLRAHANVKSGEYTYYSSDDHGLLPQGENGMEGTLTITKQGLDSGAAVWLQRRFLEAAGLSE